uniref:Uncharacterized protein n=1 Tax=Yersinia enterocolitica W22703 TaxID=913028 RepID=F4MZ81_YEREN|nr:unknown protein [Yersinia enterocolitica W22703]
MDKSLFDDNKVIALIGLLLAALIVVSTMFVMTYMADRQRNEIQTVDVQNCYKKTREYIRRLALVSIQANNGIVWITPVSGEWYAGAKRY